MAVVAIPVGWLSDKVISKGYLTTTVARRVFMGIGCVLPAAGLVWLSYSGCNFPLVTAALCFAVGSNAFVYAGFYVRRNRRLRIK